MLNEELLFFEVPIVIVASRHLFFVRVWPGAKLMDEMLLTAIAGTANGVPMQPHRVAEHLGVVTSNNERIATAALARLGVDRPPVYFDTFRAAHARGSGRK